MGPTRSICLNTKKELTFFHTPTAYTFKKHFANLASDLVSKLLDPTGRFGIPSVRQYYKEINFNEKNLNLKKLVQWQFWKCKRNLKPTGSNIPCTPIAKIYNLSIKLASLPDKCKVANIKPLYKKVSKLTQRTSGPSSCFRLSLRLSSKLFMIKLWTFYQITMSDTNINQVLENLTQQALVCHTSMTKSQKVLIQVPWQEWFLLIYKRRSIQLITTF